MTMWFFKMGMIGDLDKITFGDIGRMPGGREGKVVETVLYRWIDSSLEKLCSWGQAETERCWKRSWCQRRADVHTEGTVAFCVLFQYFLGQVKITTWIWFCVSFFLALLYGFLNPLALPLRYIYLWSSVYPLLVLYVTVISYLDFCNFLMGLPLFSFEACSALAGVVCLNYQSGYCFKTQLLYSPGSYCGLWGPVQSDCVADLSVLCLRPHLSPLAVWGWGSNPGLGTIQAIDSITEFLALVT